MSVSDARDCTALVVDIRDFTAAYREAGEDDEAEFLSFLQRFYVEVLTCVELAEPNHADSSVYLNSTGDGAVAVFFDPNHAALAYAAGLLMCNRMPRFFADAGHAPHGNPLDAFGVGIESGRVRVIDAATESAEIRTCIGGAINVAARLESQTKLYARTPMLVGVRLFGQLSAAIDPTYNYSDVRRRALELPPGPELTETVDALEAMNRRLRLRYVNHLYLHGVAEPLPTFRYSPSLRGTDDDLLETIRAFFGERPGVVRRFAARLHG